MEREKEKSERGRERERGCVCDMCGCMYEGGWCVEDDVDRAHWPSLFILRGPSTQPVAWRPAQSRASNSRKRGDCVFFLLFGSSAATAAAEDRSPIVALRGATDHALRESAKYELTRAPPCVVRSCVSTRPRRTLFFPLHLIAFLLFHPHLLSLLLLSLFLSLSSSHSSSHTSSVKSLLFSNDAQRENPIQRLPIIRGALICGCHWCK